MSEQLTVQKAVEILGISEGDSLDDAKRAYKRQMHRFHPDRFPNDVNAQKQAASKFSQLKKCYQLIEEHFNMYGEMPFQDDDKNAEQRKRRERNKKDQAEENFLQQSSTLLKDPELRTVARRQHKPVAPQPPAKPSRAGKAAALLCIAGLAGYFALNHSHLLFPQEVDPSVTEIDSTELDYRVSIQLDPNAEKAEEMSLSDQLIQEELKAKAVLSKLNANAANTQSNKTFTYGSSYSEVAEIHGPPDHSDQKTWYYNSSKVVFDNEGHVIDWTSDPSYPLAIRLK